MDHRIRKWLKWSLLYCVCLAGLAGCQHRSSTQPAPMPPSPGSPLEQGQEPSAKPPDKGSQAPQPLLQMSLDEKIGQMIFAGIDGEQMNPETRGLLQNDHVGGLILYKPNVKNSGQLVNLLNTLKRANAGNKAPLWLGMDEEGGRVTRLPDEMVKTPANQTIGRTANPAFAYGVGSLLGKELSAYGLNVDFAPVLDVNSNPNNPVIGDRSFGTTASLVSSMGVQTMKGLQEQRVLPVLKHFPGHGDTSVDSHVGLPVVQNDLNRLRKLELIPFAEAFKKQADAVMVAHTLLPRIDAKVPASLSREIMTNLLRNEMGYDGVIMTDDMTMGAIEQNYTLGEAAVQSVLAGTNVVLVGHEYGKVTAVIQALRQAVQDHRIPEETIDQSVARILKLKQKYQVKDTPVPVPDVDSLNASVKDLLKTYMH
ncbi:beta-N-acetylhexosaminidase [Paenibacillus rigui]|uniref:beta-N-acetylhexosaminidase n=1 Tax=Paenibacillus rigui TaxID=554312 RepID=A0A229UGL4_9BACL|nr:beta-N-acetylhexosaminidase [Paenibacillus rigui]OXM82537.1 beta-N-acetylhexosaminidase [Paenibacillus rigui]